MPVKALPVEQLRLLCDPDSFHFNATDDLEPSEKLSGQDRARKAIDLAASMKHGGFNLFVMAGDGAGARQQVTGYLQEIAERGVAPDDTVYVHNFDESHRPHMIQLKPGKGPLLAKAMDEAIEELKETLPSLFQNEEYRARRQEFDEAFQKRQVEAFEVLSREAESKGAGMVRSQTGFGFVPMKNGEAVKPEEFRELPESEREQIQATLEKLQGKLQEVAAEIPDWDRDRRNQVKNLNRDFTQKMVKHALTPVRKAFRNNKAIKPHLAAIEKDMEFQAGQLGEQSAAPMGPEGAAAAPPLLSDPNQLDALLHRYSVNVVVCHDPKEGAPVVFEDHPTLGNLVGRVEFRAKMGTMATDFSLIRSGSLHRANGGYLLLPVAQLLGQPMVWDAIKRALRNRELKIESPAQSYSVLQTTTLEPQAVPLSVKVVLFGDRGLYYRLSQMDPDFSELFKLVSDFEDQTPRDSGKEHFASMVGDLARNHSCLPLHKTAVARLNDYSARLVSDAQRLSLDSESLNDIIQEADYYARSKKRRLIKEHHIERAIESKRDRLSRVRDRSLEMITRESMLIDTDGERAGQINGLAVLSIGDFKFGKPSRISVTVRMGSGQVIDVEREASLGGTSHTKGVYILSGYIKSHYAQTYPLSLSASIAFEQSYGGVDGDSASSTELYAMLSALSEAPIQQGLAVTGSVNQFGDVQVIGGANEKIEGFFEICRQRGLNGNQGVLVPVGNVKNLMLHKDVVEAVKEGKFSIYAVSNIDEGIEILTGVSAEAIHDKVEARLRSFAEQRRDFAKGEDDCGEDNDTELLA